jgi:hypothetical protein
MKVHASERGPSANALATPNDVLKQETDHFFQAELHHDQRASWLLGLASGLLTAVLGVLVVMNDRRLATSGRELMIWSAGAFGVSILLSLLALWPLAGQNGRLWNPFNSRARRGEEKAHKPFTVESHYAAHRLRARYKANRIVYVIVSLIIGVTLGVSGVTMSLGSAP